MPCSSVTVSAPGLLSGFVVISFPLVLCPGTRFRFPLHPQYSPIRSRVNSLSVRGCRRGDGGPLGESRQARVNVPRARSMAHSSFPSGAPQGLRPTPIPRRLQDRPTSSCELGTLWHPPSPRGEVLPARCTKSYSPLTCRQRVPVC